MKILAEVLIVVLLVVSFSNGQDKKEDSGGKFHGYMAGDYYYNVDHHDSELKGKNGFWFRRIYFTYDYNFNKNFSTRLRLEMSDNGNYISETTLTPFVKDAYLAYSFGNQKAVFGISPPPTFDLIEKFWGYRPVEKTALDQQRMASSRDFGLALKGQFDKQGMFKYNVMVGNGSGNKQEIDKGKALMGSLSFWPQKEIVFEVYGDLAQRDNKADTYIAQAFAGYKTAELHGGLQYSHQNLTSVGDTNLTYQMNVLSAFLAGELFENIKLFGRVDRMFNPNPDGDKVAYTPFDTSASFTEIIIGADFEVNDNVYLIPNMALVLYDTNDAGIKPVNDIYVRMTFYWVFN